MDEVNHHATRGTDKLPAWDAALDSSSPTFSVGGKGLAFYDSSASETVPILKLGNVDPSVKSIYLSWYRPLYCFDFKLELRNASGELISSYEDRTRSALTGHGPSSPYIYQLMVNTYAEWNIDVEPTPNFTFPSLSTLNTSITSAAFDDTGNITLSGEVTASETGATTYKAIATTKAGLTNTQVRDLINTSAYSEAVVDYVPLSEFEALFGTGWEQIKYVAPESTTYFPGNDNLLGYAGDEFLFTTGDFSKWLIADHEQVNGTEYGFANRTIKRSSVSDVPYEQLWAYDGGQNIGNQSPMVHLGDGISPSAARTSETLLYMENGAQTVHYGHTNIGEFHPGGLYVYTRTAPASDSLPSASTTIPKVLDANYQIVPAESVNYANVYLYGTDGVAAHDDMAVKTIDPMNLQEVRIMSDSVSTVVGTAFKTSIDGSSSILSGGSFQIFPESGDKIHFSSYYSTRTGMAMFDGIISVESGQNPDTHSWLGGNGVDPIYAVYEFSSGENRLIPWTLHKILITTLRV